MEGGLFVIAQILYGPGVRRLRRQGSGNARLRRKCRVSKLVRKMPESDAKCCRYCFMDSQHSKVAMNWSRGLTELQHSVEFEFSLPLTV